MYRYQKIHTHIWHKSKFQMLSDDSKLLYFYFMTSPHSNSIGFYVLPPEYILGDLKWSNKRLSKSFRELLDKQFILYEKSTSSAIVRNHLKHNGFKNNNQVIAAQKILKDLPRSDLLLKMKIIGAPFYDKLMKPFRELLGELLHKQFRNTESRRQKTESRRQKTEEETVLENCFILPEWVNKKAWEEFEQHRKEIREPLTDLGRAKAVKKLEGHNREIQQKMIDNSIDNKWTGIFPLKGNGKNLSQKDKQAELERRLTEDEHKGKTSQ